ncbi:Chymotrypsin-1 [Bulinus truncatus]|nr:Chymotrypsin-1 [Bulinus truncatus]
MTFTCILFLLVQDSRIINGVEAQLFSRPYQASLQVHIPNRGWFHICGAAIIDVDRLVSAAHCLIPFPADRLRVEVGVLNLKAPPLEYTQFVDVLKVEWRGWGVFRSCGKELHYLQDDYLSYPNDIGVIYLKHPMVYNENVQPAKIAPVGQTFDEQECSIFGWGSTRFGGPSSAKLQEANMTKWTYERCFQVHQDNGYFVGPKHACVKGIVNDQGYAPGACQGDSGGPLMCGEKRIYLLGVSSYVFDECSRNYRTRSSLNQRRNETDDRGKVSRRRMKLISK